MVDVATGGTDAPCKDNAATLEDKYAYFDNNFEFEDGDKIIRAVKVGLSKGTSKILSKQMIVKYHQRRI